MLTLERCALPEGYVVAWDDGGGRVLETWFAPECCPLVIAWAALRAEIDRRRCAS